jgi:curved DNA-binding protein CbpA
MAHKDDYYRVLGVSQDATTPEIRRAYRRLARQHHPDRNPEPDSSQRFRTLAEAYAVLADPARRARYDHIVQAPASRDVAAPRRDVAARRSMSALGTRFGVLELSPREARLAATGPLTLTTSGLTIVLPAGLADGDQLTIDSGGFHCILTVRVNFRSGNLI